MKTTLLSLFVFLFAFSSFAQQAQLHPLTKLDIGFQGLGFTSERRLFASATIDISAGVGGGYTILPRDFTYSANPVDAAGYVAVTPKFFYNLKKRSEKGKTASLNSGNYIGLRIKYATKSFSGNGEGEDALLLNMQWGIQRMIAKKWSVTTHIGIGYAINATDLNHPSGAFYPSIGFNFSYMLNHLRS